MTIFDILSERESLLKDSQGGMSFHFLSPARITSFEVFPRRMTTPKNFDLALSWREFEFQFDECQEPEKDELEELVQLLFVLELRHKFWNLTQHEGVFSLHAGVRLSKPSSTSAAVS